MFPARPSICLYCRVALTGGEACTWLSHQTADLAGDCEPLIEQVWGAALVIDRLPRLWELLVPGAPPETVTVRERERDRPIGAPTEPMVPVTAVGFRGRVEEGPTAPVPLSEQQAAGFALELRHHGAAGSPVMLRDGATVGFSVAGDDGRVFLVPPGGLRMPVQERPDAVRDRRVVHAYLRHLAPDAGAPSPFPWDEVHTAILMPGDLVTVRAVATVRPDPRGITGYREAPRSILMASGAAWVERHA